MKREIKRRLVVTFYTTASAMAMERLCKDAGIDGRIIPVPRSLTSDCGMAWRMTPEDRERLLDALSRRNVEIAGMVEMNL